ncbi:transglutaminase-like domain-containing protein [Tunicatimonas pelagia]|uniref:transglutaminase-like domain-containing protein n=1 Tax=Tunicatimonas pelagia TaxID=931531 RepID=UPI002665CB88|nr:transglutaminase family protein [Tunicatimonas pelagia]WKN45408.1 transglutaminase family protein [Tunicatimonas pelagia]
MKQYLKETALLNYPHPQIQQLVDQRGWRYLSTEDKIRSIYLFVRDEILFGYNAADDISATRILADGYGQCNTKSTLLMALLRAVDVPCRFHGFTINKALQKGAISGLWYKLAPQNILHSWVEVWHDERWFYLEGVILDRAYLTQLQSKFEGCTTFCGFGAYTEDLQNPAIDWQNNDTFIQRLGINQDFGLFSEPDSFYSKHQQKMSLVKRLAFRYLIRHQINDNVRGIRDQGRFPVTTALVEADPPANPMLIP